MRQKRTHNTLLLGCGLTLGVGLTEACSEQSASRQANEGSDSNSRSLSGSASSGSDSIEAELMGRSGSYLEGEVTARAQDGKTEITVEVQNAIAGEHGVHLHENADCNGQDAESAGAVLNPQGKKKSGEARLGDLGNIEVGAMGKGEATFSVDLPLVADDRSGVKGHALVIHARPDGIKPIAGVETRRVGCAELTGTPGPMSQR